VTHVGGTDLARSTLRLAILELVLNCHISVYGGAESLQEEEEQQQKQEKEQEEKEQEKNNCATSRKVASSIPDDVMEIFH